VVPQRNKCLVFYDDAVEAATISNNAITHSKRLLTVPTAAINAQSITLSHDNTQFAILSHQESTVSLYYSTPTGVTHVEVPITATLRLEEVFWLKERLIGVDSSLFFYDLTHEKELVQLQSDRKDSLPVTEGEQMEEEVESANYDQLYRRYL
jgi:hypothetical protein